MEEKYTVEEVAGKLKVSQKTILREIKRGKLGTEKAGRRHLISETGLNNYLLEGSEPVKTREKSKAHIPLNRDLPSEHVFQTAEDENCGVCCLVMVYKKRGINTTVGEVLREMKLPDKGEYTYPPQLARHLLSHGVRTNLIVSNTQVISPAWKHAGRQDLIENLKNWLVFQPNHNWHVNGLHSLFYLEEGGNIELKAFDSMYLKKLIDRGSQLILCLDGVSLWGHRLRDGIIEDLRGKSSGHYVVVIGYIGDKFKVLDPFPTKLEGKEGEYEVDGIDLVAATLTWSGTILEVLE